MKKRKIELFIVDIEPMEDMIILQNNDGNMLKLHNEEAYDFFSITKSNNMAKKICNNCKYFIAYNIRSPKMCTINPDILKAINNPCVDNCNEFKHKNIIYNI